MMIAIDQDTDQSGVVIATHYFDSSNPASIAAIQKMQTGTTDKTAAGWMQPCRLPLATGGMTRWGVLVAQAHLDAAVAALGLTP